MKFSNRYSFNFGGAASGLSEKLKKLLGLEAVKTQCSLEGELSCEITVDEIKEIFETEDSRLKKFRQYIADGRLKSDTLEIVNIIGDAMCEAEKVDRRYTEECTNSSIFKTSEDTRLKEAVEKDLKEAVKRKAAEAKSEE